ncbi:MAG: hypothetical protein M1814_001128 [Vezdaea aestivalis]|nr:MAG: hypothetical protein M1814_001128 [Vezdaea aestivalis]
MVSSIFKGAPLHPYSPATAIIAGYADNEMSVPLLLVIFAGVCAGIIAFTLAVVSYVQPQMRGSEKATVFWFTLCGCIHFFFEGYFAVNHASMGPSQSLFGQLWKEYALSDSRYLTSDPFVLCMESITAVGSIQSLLRNLCSQNLQICWGPLSFVIAGMIVSGHPARHPLQLVVSLGQIYGDILYYGTSMFDHYFKAITYCRPEAYYFWGYYFLMNFFWIVIPGILFWNSFSAMSRAMKAVSAGLKAPVQNGNARGPAVGASKKHA